MDRCRILMENRERVFQPGGEIRGRVLFNFETRVIIRNIKIIARCRETTEWMGEQTFIDSMTRSERKRVVPMHGYHEPYEAEARIFRGDVKIKTRTVDFGQWVREESFEEPVTRERIIRYVPIYGSIEPYQGELVEGDTGATSLKAGKHVFLYNIHLPKNIPSSFSCEYGSISYILTVLIDSIMQLDHAAEMPFEVRHAVHLGNLHGAENLLDASSYSEDKEINCCRLCCRKWISIDVELPKKTLVLGETVPIQARVTNKSKIDVDYVLFELRQKIHCAVLQPVVEKKCIEKVLFSMEKSGLRPYGDQVYEFPVLLPRHTELPNFVNKSRLFEVSYEYKITVKLPEKYGDMEIRMCPKVGHFDVPRDPSSVDVALPFVFRADATTPPPLLPLDMLFPRSPRDMASPRSSRDMASPRSSRDMASPRSSRDMASPRSSRDMASPRASRDMAPRRSRSSRDMASPRSPRDMPPPNMPDSPERSRPETRSRKLSATEDTVFLLLAESDDMYQYC